MTDVLQADPSPEQLVADLIDLHRLTRHEEDLFEGGMPAVKWKRVYGGQVIGQALMAASHTVDSARAPHSLHAYFMRPGNPDIPIFYRVRQDRDGASFSTRRVIALQNDIPILTMATSFQIPEQGLSHQFPMPSVPGPDGLLNEQQEAIARLHDVPAEWQRKAVQPRPIEFRPVTSGLFYESKVLPPHSFYWFRAVAPLPDDPVLHRAIFAYATDNVLLQTSLRPHVIDTSMHLLQEASLDHSLWIHEDFRIDEWLLYAVDSPWAGHARGFNRGSIYTRDGRLVASAAQEGLIRIRDRKPEA